MEEINAKRSGRRRVAAPQTSALYADLETITVEDLADLCKVTVPTVYAWNTKGTGPRVTRVGKYVRFRLGDVREWLDRRAAAEAEVA